MSFMQNPVTHGKYTKQDLRDYAIYRKEGELESIKDLLENNQITEGLISPSEHEDYREPLAFSKKITIDIQLQLVVMLSVLSWFLTNLNKLLKAIITGLIEVFYEEVKLTDVDLDWVDSLYMVSEWLNYS